PSTATPVTVALGNPATFTVTNNDQPAHLTLLKTVDHGTTGATTPATAWTLSATGPSSITGSTGTPPVTNAPIDAGTYALAEIGPSGYDATGWTCTAGTLTGDTLALAPGGSATCTITNTAQPPPPTPEQRVANNDSGPATATDS